MKISRGIKKRAQRFVIYGPEGIGKTTFASKFPDPVFIDTENGSDHLDVARFEDTDTWQGIINAVEAVGYGEVDCKTLVIDTADWAEKRAIGFVLDYAVKGMKANGIEDFGYGKGYVYLAETFQKLLQALDKVVDRGINVVVTAHAQLKKIEQPDETGAYDHWELKLEKKTSPLLKEWSDVLLFANYKTNVVKVENTNKARGGQRVIYTSHTTAWDAKNRFGLPEKIDMDIKPIEHLIVGMGAEVEPKNEKQSAEQKEPAKKEENKDKVQAKERPIDRECYRKLLKLMDEKKIDSWDVQNFVAAKGIYSAETNIWEYTDDFINNQIIAKWDVFSKKVLEAKETENVPFE